MNYTETLEFLFSSLPMYQRVGPAAYKASLDTSLQLDADTGHPHRSYPSIHVAGTNGKGSVCHMLASVLQQAGYRTGLYTSPHLLDFRERIRINGIPIGEMEVIGFVERNNSLIRRLHPSFFEMTVAMAFDYFAREQVDVAVVETGLGGRLDSTNILSPVLSVITNISKDHTEFLGTDLLSIAREKGGIIKENTPVVIGKVDRTVEELFMEMSGAKKAEPLFASQLYEPGFATLDPEGAAIFRIRNGETGALETVRCDLAGSYQIENVITVLATLAKLKELGWKIPPGAQEEGMASVTRNTGILGRWQTIGRNPRSICDTAHNAAGIAAVVDQIKQIPWKKLHMVWGMVAGKDMEAILPLLPREAGYYFTRPEIPRGMDPEVLREQASRFGLEGGVYPAVKEAYRVAQQYADEEDMIFTGGSTFVVADLLKASGY